MPQVLVICSANRCRSPMAEAFLREELVDRDVKWDVASAGLYSGGSPVVEEVETTMARYGIDVSEHRSRRLVPQLIDEVDLILTMERRHGREVAIQVPAALARTFTVKDFVARTRSNPPSEGKAADQYFEILSSDRDPKAMMGSSTSDEVADPLGQGQEVFESSAEELRALMAEVADVLAQLG